MRFLIIFNHVILTHFDLVLLLSFCLKKKCLSHKTFFDSTWQFLPHKWNYLNHHQRFLVVLNVENMIKIFASVNKVDQLFYTKLQTGGLTFEKKKIIL